MGFDAMSSTNAGLPSRVEVLTRLQQIPDDVLADADLLSVVADLIPGWRVVDSWALPECLVCVLREQSAEHNAEHNAETSAETSGGGWALVRFRTSAEFPSDLLAADPSAKPRHYETSVRWGKATGAQRRVMLTMHDSEWVAGADLPGLWQRLAYLYDETTKGLPSAVGWGAWVNVGWRLTMEHPEGAALLNHDGIRMLLAFAAEAQVMERAWASAYQAARIYLSTLSHDAIVEQIRDLNHGWPLQKSAARAIGEAVLPLLFERLGTVSYLEEHSALKEARASTQEPGQDSVTDFVPPIDPSISLHDCATMADVDRAVADILATLDWRSLITTAPAGRT